MLVVAVNLVHVYHYKSEQVEIYNDKVKKWKVQLLFLHFLRKNVHLEDLWYHWSQIKGYPYETSEPCVKRNSKIVEKASSLDRWWLVVPVEVLVGVLVSNHWGISHIFQTRIGWNRNERCATLQKMKRNRTVITDLEEWQVDPIEKKILNWRTNAFKQARETLVKELEEKNQVGGIITVAILQIELLKIFHDEIWARYRSTYCLFSLTFKK